MNTLAECYRYCDNTPNCVAFDIMHDGICILSNTECSQRSSKPTSKVDYTGYYYPMKICDPVGDCEIQGTDADPDVLSPATSKDPLITLMSFDIIM